MSSLHLVWIALLVVGCHAVPEGYILNVTHSCGELDANNKPINANVNIISDLQAQAVLTCRGATDDSNRTVTMVLSGLVTKTNQSLYYPGDTSANADKDCYFFHSHSDSNVYVVQLDVYWGFEEGNLMNEYQRFTITCTSSGNANTDMSNKDVNENVIPVANNLEGHLGASFSETSNLTLIDVFGQDITASNVPMGKKVALKLSLQNRPGLTPYECYASSGNDATKIKILNAGCGDGVIFPKNKGFTTKDQSATSPVFKFFKLRETGDAKVSFSCSFAACNATCDGSSCYLRSKRSVTPSDEEVGQVRSRQYDVETLNDRMDQTERKINDARFDARLGLSTVALYGVAVLALFSLLVAIYTCFNVERRFRKFHSKA